MLHLAPWDVDRLTYEQVMQAIEQLDELKRRTDDEQRRIGTADN